MMNGREELLKALTDAYIMEKETCNFYQSSSHLANEDDAKTAFRELASRKQTQMKYIQSLFRTVQAGGEIVTLEELKRGADIQLEEGWVPVKEQEMNYSYTDDTGILIDALEIEAKTHELYRRLAESATDGRVKAVFREMMTQEDWNINFLKKMPGTLIEE